MSPTSVPSQSVPSFVRQSVTMLLLRMAGLELLSRAWNVVPSKRTSPSYVPSQRPRPADCANPRTVPCGSPCSTVQAGWTYCVMARSAGSAASRPAQNSASTQASQQPARRQNFMGTGRRTINSGSNLGRTIDLVGSEGGSMVTQEGRAGDGERRAGGGKGRRERRAKGEGRLKGWKGQRACLSLPFSLSAFISRHFDLVA